MRFVVSAKPVLFAVVMTLCAAPLGAQARVALRDDTRIENGLTVVTIGKMLTKGCEEIAPRRIKAFSFARGLYSHAKRLGYDAAEIDAYLDSDADKNRLKAAARTYLSQKGVDFDDPATICAVGRSEIAAETAVGRFLRLR